MYDWFYPPYFYLAGFLLIKFTIFVHMKATVKRAFTCVLGAGYYPVGSTYEGSTERIADLEARGYVIAEYEPFAAPKADEATHTPKAEKKAPKKPKNG